MRLLQPTQWPQRYTTIDQLLFASPAARSSAITTCLSYYKIISHHSPLRSFAGRLKSVILALQYGFYLADKHSCLDKKTTGRVCEEGKDLVAFGSLTLACSSTGRLKSVILALQYGFYLADKHSCLDKKTTGGVCEEGGRRLGSDCSLTLAGRSTFLVCSLLLSGVQ
jgi:hypothetical protein